MLHRCRPLLIAAVLAVSAGFARPHCARADTGADLYTVHDVAVDVTAASADAARDQAIGQGARKAFQTLVQRLSPNGQDTVSASMSDSQIQGLLAGFEVQSERTSLVRYVGTLTFTFKPQAVQQALQGAGVQAATIPSSPVVVLPVVRDGARAVLWEEHTDWRTAWENVPANGGLVPVVVPLGGLGDIAEIDATNALVGSQGPLNAIAKQYQAGDVVVARLDETNGTIDPKQPLTIAVTRYAMPDATPSDQSVTVQPQSGETAPQMLARAATSVVAALDKQWKQRSAAMSGQQNHLTVMVPIGGLKDWIATRQRLGQVPMVTGVQIDSLDQSQATIELSYAGSTDDLRGALAQHALTLSEPPPGQLLWQLSPAATQ